MVARGRPLVIGYLDCSTGVSGDKFLGAVLSVGARMNRFSADDLGALMARIVPEAVVIVEPTSSRGIGALSVRVEASSAPPLRHLGDIRSLLDRAGLSASLRERSDAVFERLAEAEAVVHGVAVEQVHFHEVGALDTILDVVGTIAGLDAVGVESLTVSRVALGSGSVEAAHGLLPVPAPATAALLEGVPVHGGPIVGELTTPTGAALVAVLGTGFGACPPMIPRASGYGAGASDIGAPNVCRLTVGDADTSIQALSLEQVTLLESSIDHISPEETAAAAQQLLDEGCLDVWISPIVMKKGRAAMLLSALVSAGDAERFAARLVALTGTLGVRRQALERFAAPREVFSVDTPFGRVAVKAGAGRARVEHDDVARIARETGRSYREISQDLADIVANTELAHGNGSLHTGTDDSQDSST
jgi:hypothetical protein